MLFEDEISKRRKIISEDGQYKEFEQSLNSLIDFMWSLSELISWNGHAIVNFIDGRRLILQSELIDSSVRTLFSIKICSQNGNLSDVNSLIRKYRDDIFLFLYFIEATSNCSITDDKATVHENNVLRWHENKLDNLYISSILKYLVGNKIVAEVIDKHNLKKVWDEIRINLNNYVHNNGFGYTLLNFVNFDKKDICDFTRDILFKIEYITVIFMTLLILIKPQYISSSDYADALTVGIEPKEGSQSNIAPFIQAFIRETIQKINPELRRFLIDNVHMVFEE